MIQATVQRLAGFVQDDHILVVTNHRLVEAIREQMPQIPAHSILGEPCKRDTAPCIGLAAALVLREDPDATMVVMPSDHVIEQVPEFQSAITEAVKFVDDNPKRLVTFGIRPTYPAESFGYIERSSQIPSDRAVAYRVKQFREKPNTEVARQYLASGDFYWNSGIFVWRAKTILDQLQEREPNMFEHLSAIAETVGKPQFQKTFEQEFSAIVGKSIDYAIMEHAQEIVTVEASFDWDDVGSWQALPRLQGQDEDGNTVSANHLGIDTEGSIIQGEKDHLIVTLGLKNCLIVQTPDATLVADKSKEEAVRDVVKMLQERKLDQYL